MSAGSARVSSSSSAPPQSPSPSPNSDVLAGYFKNHRLGRLFPWSLYHRPIDAELRLSSATVIIALLVGGKLLGIIGALLALPVAAALRMILEELRVELPGDDSAHATERDTDARAEREYIQQAAGAPPEQAAEVAGKIADQSAADNPQKDD